MRIKTLRDFQDEAVKSGVALFSAAQHLLDVAGDDAAGRRAAINHNGYLLIEAPTGSGKTLMAGCIVERFSASENVVWFWFAPFKGVVSQTEAFLRDQFQGLRMRDLAVDRANDASRGGDAFVTTWQTVATRMKDKRNVRKESETNPSVDMLVESLRARGMRIGVVVDEAHHGFGKDTQAARFFQDVLCPEYTILITATPDDADVRDFEKTMGIAELQRIRVSRADAVKAGLIKTGVKCAAYCVTDPARAALVDLQATALRDGVSTHRSIKASLEKLRVPLVPLLLVQADSRVGSIEKIKERLLASGFTEEQIAVHTAEEPDAGLLAIANDDRREVLIFKMAVALGFDAPRAFTLVSMRASRDTDFGVQIIGRILRVHRLLQGRVLNGDLPESLRYGYVFLADPETQDGLDKAGQRINQIQTEYAKISQATVVLRMGDDAALATVEANGQTVFMLEGDPVPAVPASSRTPIPEDKPGGEFDLDVFFNASDANPQPAQSEQHPYCPAQNGEPGKYRYPLRDGVPVRFKTQELGSNEASEADCADHFVLSARDLLNAMKKRIPVEKRTLEVFTQQIQHEFDFSADLSSARAARLAYDVLCRNWNFDPRELRPALLKKLTAVMREESMEEADHPEKVRSFLNTLLATDPKKLREAQKAAVAKNARIRDTEAPLPVAIESIEPLPVSRGNIYGVYPPDMNNWECEFARFLDRSGDVILWWHRNEPRKDWSVNVLMPDGTGFYPDFVIGIKGRKTENGVLLADPKLNFVRADEAPKVLAKHKTYGRVLIVTRDERASRWLTAAWDEKQERPVIGGEFRLADAAGFGL
jgi:DNA or RNA helicases of superfamily II